MRLRSLALLLVIAAVLPGPAIAATAAVPALDHIIVVVLENKDWAQVRDAPYTTSLRQGGSEMIEAYGVTKTASQPNYFALFAGNTFGVTSNFCPLSNFPATSENLGHTLEAAGKTWRAYSENLSATGGTECNSGGTSPLYTRKHDPWTYFSNLDHNNERVYTDLASDIANQTLPNLAFVIPNNCHNMHNTGCTVEMGDTWLSQNLPAMIDAVGSNGVVILTWDEDDDNDTQWNNNHILTVFKGTQVKPGYQSSMAITHYNVLRTICDAFGVVPMGNAASHGPITDIWFDGVLGTPKAMDGMRLSSPMPNPSHGGVTARLVLPEPVAIEAGIYDAAGHAIRGLMSGRHSGTLELRWDGRREDGSPARAGLYFLRVRAGNEILQRKTVVIR